MNVMQTLAEFKQNLHGQAHPVASGAPAARSAVQPLATAPATTSTTSGSNSTTITANDFLQLLVAEMKNQDPTATQDPNAYIDQLVQVNSLQQLISINQDLTPASSGAVSAADAGARSRRSEPQLGSAAGTPAASVATSLAAPPAQPLAAAAAIDLSNGAGFAKADSVLPPAVRAPAAQGAGWQRR